MKSINTLTELLKVLDRTDEKDYKNIIDQIQIASSEFKSFEFWNQERYTRNCIVRNDKFELLLLCWEPGQETPIHCHNEQECWVYMIEGKIYEKHYKKDSNGMPIPQDSFVLDPETHCYMNDGMGVHSLHNSDTQRSLSLHLYAKPIDECSYFDEKLGAFKTVSLTYHTRADIVSV